ncbi:MAG TPA: hypothetical protein VIK77_02860 [Tissierellaceae bacterium]
MTKEEYNEILFCFLCSYGDLVSNMLNNWSIGVFNSCKEEQVIELSVILTILLNYNVKDLPDFTTEYNNLTKTDIMNLIDLFKLKLEC